MTAEKARVWRKILEGLEVLDQQEELDMVKAVLDSDPLGGPMKVRMRLAEGAWKGVYGNATR